MKLDTRQDSFCSSFFAKGGDQKLNSFLFRDPVIVRGTTISSDLHKGRIINPLFLFSVPSIQQKSGVAFYPSEEYGSTTNQVPFEEEKVFEPFSFDHSHHLLI